jgi:chromosome segregation ATPase
MINIEKEALEEDLAECRTTIEDLKTKNNALTQDRQRLECKLGGLTTKMAALEARVDQKQNQAQPALEEQFAQERKEWDKERAAWQRERQEISAEAVKQSQSEVQTVAIVSDDGGGDTGNVTVARLELELDQTRKYLKEYGTTVSQRMATMSKDLQEVRYSHP